MKKIYSVAIVFICCSYIFALPSPQAMYNEAYSMQRQRDYYSAIEQYQMILKTNPSYNLIYERLAQCFYELQEYDQAYDFVLKAQSYKKSDTTIEALKGFILIGLDKRQEAKTLFNTILSVKPNDMQAKFGLAEIEIAEGRISVASKIYKEILAIRPENKKALLAMAIIEYQGGNNKESNKYIKTALKAHGNDEVTSYFAAYINALQEKYELSEAYLQTALKIKKDYDDALSLLSQVLYEGQRYFEVIKICDRQISNNKKAKDAWYMKSLSLLKLGRKDEALQCAKITLALMPSNEIARLLLEQLAVDILDFEDKFRKELAKYHSEKANSFNNKNESEKALFEYRRALKMYPYDAKSREFYARILLRKGYTQRYFEELQFIKNNGAVSKKIEDSLESYGKLLEGSLINKWEIDPLFLDKNHISISLFFDKKGSTTILPDTGKLAVDAIADVFSYNRRFKINIYENAPVTYTESFKMARERGDTYFGLVKVNESNSDLTLTLELYISRTGKLIKTFNVYRSDNDRYSLSIRRLFTLISSSMPTVGVILDRWQHTVLVDIGKDDFTQEGSQFEIVDKNKVKTGKDDLSIVYDEDAILGYFDVGKIEEDVSEGTIREKGFYDKINKGDYVVVKKKDDKLIDELMLKPKENSFLLFLIRKIKGE